MNELFKQDIRYLKGVGEKKAGKYKKLGISTVGGLITHYPRSYTDFSNPLKISETVIGGQNIIKARIFKKGRAQRISKNMTVYKLYATDDESDITITIFNSSYLFDRLKEGESYYFKGKITGNMLRKEMQSPQVVEISETSLIKPVYRLTQGLTSQTISNDVKTALGLLNGTAEELCDPLSEDIRMEFSLCHIRFALENIHFPQNSNAVSEARRRLIFDELLTLNLGLFRLKRRRRIKTGLVADRCDKQAFYKKLPFELTNAQKRVIGEIAADLESGRAMNRLVQGDVGSGKTMTAAAACEFAADSGMQSAVMAPTEILAKQHYETFIKLFSEQKVCLLTGAMRTSVKKDVLKKLENGEYDIAVGTHALTESGVKFKRLGLVVTDEQHRFGVEQRAKLIEKGESPHVLVMSATPIPRTLALTIYGDLDVSVIDELPAGRVNTKTLVINGKKRGRALSFIKSQIAMGRQAYIVCPLAEESESDLKNAADYFESLKSTAFSDIPAALLHGRLKAAEKDSVMERFKQNEIKLLVATTVIEVGVDVPNATVMLIEDAERFGLSQLHQLRGRVGRSGYQSYCILLSDHRGETANSRLKTMASTNDGFKIAEEDLKLRGPGDLFGDRQHGLPLFKIADMTTDIRLLEQTRRAADNILESDPGLTDHKGLAMMIDSLFKKNENGLN